MFCPICKVEARRFSKNRNGSQRYRCDVCKKTFTDKATRPTDRRCLDQSKAIMCLRMLLEGNSVRSVERLTGVHRDTIINCMIDAGEKCKAFLAEKIKNVEVEDVQCDEIWDFVFTKQKNAIRKNYGPEVGDAWCWTAIERNTKLILAYHLGKRSSSDCYEFARKLRRATVPGFQLTSDGLTAYTTNIPEVFGGRIDFAQMVKVYGRPEGEERQYSPAQVVECFSNVVTGNPDPKKICTSHVERSNLTIRMTLRRLTRLTNAHSKKWENHEAAIALFFAYYNFCRVHSTLGTTPAVASGLATETWSLARLLSISVR